MSSPTPPEDRDISAAINKIIEAGSVPKIVKRLDRLATSYLHIANPPISEIRVARTIRDVASGTAAQVQTIIDARAIPILVKLLAHKNMEVYKLAVESLSSVCSHFRDVVLDHGALTPLLAQLTERTSPSPAVTQLVSTMCVLNTPAPYEKIASALPVLARVLLYSNDEEVLVYACNPLAIHCIGTPEKIQIVTEAPVCSKLVELLRHTSTELVYVAIRVISNIALGNFAHIQVIIDCPEAFSNLSYLLTSDVDNVIKSVTCEAIYRIISGCSRRQEKAVRRAGLISQFIPLLKTAEHPLQKRVAYALRGIIQAGTKALTRLIVTEECIETLCDLLSCPDADVVNTCLDILRNMLWHEKTARRAGLAGVNLAVQLVEQVEGKEKIEALKSHGHDRISRMAAWLLQSFWEH